MRIEPVTVKHAAASLAGMAFTTLLVSCSSGGASQHQVTNGDGPTSVSTKVDVTTLTDSMLLSEPDFPKVEGGEYQSTGIKTIDKDWNNVSDQGDIDNPVDTLRKGDQVGNAQYGRASGTAQTSFRAVLSLNHPRGDIESWASRTLPHDTGHGIATRIVIPELPREVVAVENKLEAPNGKYVFVGAVGIVRGVLVIVDVLANDTLSKPEATQDLVTLYNRQVAKLNAD